MKGSIGLTLGLWDFPRQFRFTFYASGFRDIGYPSHRGGSSFPLPPSLPLSVFLCLSVSSSCLVYISVWFLYPGLGTDTNGMKPCPQKVNILTYFFIVPPVKVISPCHLCHVWYSSVFAEFALSVSMWPANCNTWDGCYTALFAAIRFKKASQVAVKTVSLRISVAECCVPYSDLYCLARRHKAIISACRRKSPIRKWHRISDSAIKMKSRYKCKHALVMHVRRALVALLDRAWPKVCRSEAWCWRSAVVVLSFYPRYAFIMYPFYTDIRHLQ